jgi:2-oxoglutarate dehydrogenase E2 component (dihydrolipoamide succinyltransferase)
MAKHEIVMPQMGESITTGTITKWHKQAGDKVEIDEILLDISTDKVESEIPSPMEGRIAEILFEEGETVDVGVKIAVIEDDPSASLEGGSSGGGASESKSEEKEPKKQESITQESASSEKTQKTEKSSDDQPEGRRFYTPLVKKMASEADIPLSELSDIEGSGAGGRVNKADLEEYMENRDSSKASKSKSSTASNVPSGGVAEVRSSGERVEVIPMDNMRKAIARNMVESKQKSPHVNSIDEIDMTELFKFREGFKEEFKKQEGFSLTYTHFILYALVQALREHPMVNASIEGDNIVLKKDINLGCAVAVPGNGLVVPVIKNADSLNLTGIARKVNELAMKARSKKLTMDELTGGTFTFTNVGSFGTLMATPVILQPQLGIFAAGVIKKRPVITADDAIAVRQMMYGTHTYDHRLVDGELGGKFLETVKQKLQQMDPKSLF